ncbi:hypothetical protein IB236_21850 [Acidovorax sp. ACV02]|uniref:hypothetical protein n=1 Tax=Acidovorax sp. ACV02 TaxID=2769310 RepID=UPI00178051C7|nr:hypothetical protein [Acidovorax sp. ACV02]MBD9407985.1 hypothetical protein [Acidovorax sp. ACV02]
MTEIFIPGFLNSRMAVNIGQEPHPRGIDVQNIPHGPVYFAMFAGCITLDFMRPTQRRIVLCLSLAALLGFCLWLFFDPGFEPAIGVLASAAGLATSFWPRFRESYAAKRLSGRATFDYSNNNGVYVIGEGDLAFETKWSKASDTSIHLYNDPPSIESVAIALGATSIEAVTDASSYDGSSRSRKLQEGEVAVLKNRHGNFAALQVLDVKDRTRSDDRDELTFRYVINPEGERSFSQ